MEFLVKIFILAYTVTYKTMVFSSFIFALVGKILLCFK